MLSLRRSLCRARVLVPLAAVLIAGLLYWHPWRRPITIVEKVNPRDGAALVWVPSGSFRMGTSDRTVVKTLTKEKKWIELRDVMGNRLRGETDFGEQPVHTVLLDGYWIYKYEVTVAQYRAFCRATGRKMPAKPAWGWQDDYPVVNVSWLDAQAYATWAGAILPTEAQWEKAASSVDGRLFPWGNVWDGGKCRNRSINAKTSQPAAVGSYPAGASPYGAQDMAGNVWEWCADWYDEGYYPKSPARNPTGPVKGFQRAKRGGSWRVVNPFFLRAAGRSMCYPGAGADVIGFRCVVRSPGP